ncbi:MAG: DNA polymerase III subunit gamma/tau [Bryobacteraceae bacterium]|nr:DNA polymerase III subunit gamma/tau [Bryobacteraceae bacterium]MDW8376816.1 DNA polymerase III subunit gamma/tau [Bryobacterales bacterium]
MYQVIARKYRPQNFRELVGQEHVRTTLENAISQRRIAHGYIFSGQRGTGKTTVARILARCLNCEKGPTLAPCGECASCREIGLGSSPDVIEIDAASNRGINEMRELRESVRYRPARDRFKVFIIDEAHQITNEAFNALLKTLEEPPEWVVFVLCTTEAHKIPNTIASRCQHFSFRSVDYEAVVGLLEQVCRAESIDAEAEALSWIALAGEGSVRDSLSALDQAIACCGPKISASEVRQLLGRFSLQTLEQVAEALLAGDSGRMLDIVQELESAGQNLQHFCRELCRFFRNLLVARIAGADTRLIPAAKAERERLGEIAQQFSEEDLTRYLNLTLDLFSSLQHSLQPRMHLELGLVRLVHAGRLRSIEEILAASAPGLALQSKGERTRGGAPAQAKPAAESVGPARQFVPVSSAAENTALSSRTAAAKAPRSESPGSDLRSRLLTKLQQQGMAFLADAVEHSVVEEKPGEVGFTAAKEFGLALRSTDLAKVVESILGRPVKITVQFKDAAQARPAATGNSLPQQDETTRRALENPEVRRYRELFPGSEVRAVQNLKESS